jgi:hypothetical protein
MDEPQIQQQAVRIPTSLNDEDSFVQVAELNLSLRQILTVGLFSGLWFMLAKILAGFLGMGMFWTLLLFSPIVFLGFFLAFIKRSTETGKKFILLGSGVPVEDWLADMIRYRILPKNYTLTKPRDLDATYENAAWAEIEEQENEDDFYMGGGL